MSPSPAASLCLLALFFAASLEAQLPSNVQRGAQCEIPTDPDAMARYFAPTLIFAPNERDFPTIPFFTAFDGKQNFESDNGIDFDDLEELIPGSASAAVTGQVSWDRLYAEAHRDDDGGRLGNGVPPAVFYRTRELEEKERHELWRFLRKDSQAWRRFNMDALLELGLEDASLLSVEYYYYYLDDNGLAGHKQDIEFTFLFVPLDPDLACRFRVLVGAGHDARTPNNVLVLFDTDDQDEPHHITVELGGHASAPSSDQADGFRVGRDVNWHATQAWGTRDLLATTGTAFMGPYRTGMTFPRNIALGINAVYRPEWRMEEDSVCSDLRQDEICMADERAYDLLPVAPFEQLALAIDALDVTRAAAALAQIDDALPAFDAPSEITTDQLELLRAWRIGLFAEDGEEMSVGKHSIWTHEHYTGSPNRIFKEHLYPPSVWSMVSFLEVTRLVTYGFGGVPYQGYEFYAGVIIPRIPYIIDVPGLVEVQVGFALSSLRAPRESSLTLALQYDSEYRQYFGWYARVAYMDERARITGDSAARDFTVSGGLSLLGWRDPLRYERILPVNTLRLRVGPRVDVSRFGEFDFSRVGLEILVSLRQ